ncbi:MAG TPA: 3-isopropylmalate dehydratase small subunit [Planctomycetota bacterium]|nr:3-isopropylmalate dehydratase small subunit [Planctomycetota bacterium]HRR80636.1 3-isopropylmalate dehydratase small subunit [Planctomycetota bacterium]HRT97262.1 3-isopropylmalate dehydratase small subunit [Planctomycetota bacterium]
MIIKGKAWKFGDGISTDHIAPGRLFHLRSNLPELAKHCLEDARPEFASKVQKGDFVVGGRNFGQGSSREHAPIVIKLCGVGAVLAKGFARIFFRNCVNVGLPALILDTDSISEGDELEVDLATGVVRNLTKGTETATPPLPAVMRHIIADGGLVEHIRKHGRLKLD